MNSTRKKAGRKPKPYTTPDNRTVDGLYRMRDGRWKIISTGFRFTEPDERLAVAKFLELTGSEPAANAILLPQTNPRRYGRKIAKHIIGLQQGSDPAALTDPTVFWAKVRVEILSRPKWVAEQVGIEQIGYRTNLPKPERLPSPTELESIWTTHATCTKKQIKKIAAAWQDFVKSTKIKELTDIAPELVVAYRDDVHTPLCSAVELRCWKMPELVRVFSTSIAIVPRLLGFTVPAA